MIQIVINLLWIIGILTVIFGVMFFWRNWGSGISHFDTWFEAREKRKAAEREAKERDKQRAHELAMEKERALNWEIPNSWGHDRGEPSRGDAS